MNKNNQTFLKKKEEIMRRWFLFDATGKTLGRFASEIAKVLCGKHTPEYTPFADNGDGVIVLNADKIKVTGSKRVQKLYRFHTGAPGSMREVSFETMMVRHPEYAIQHAVEGMLPKTRLAKQQMKRLRIFAGNEHDLSSQKPIVVLT